MHYNLAAAELMRRGEDITFALPSFVNLALSRGSKEQIGKTCLKKYYPDTLSGINLEGKHLSELARQQLRDILEKTTANMVAD